MRKRIALAIFSAALLLVFFEAFARFGLGLGTPPLSVVHPKIEYMFAPNQHLWRFGNLQLYNHLGMRSPDLDGINASRRVLVMGDSVVNGGNLTDHGKLATTVLSNDQVFYGNVSAGSWGPANLAAWLEEFGSQGADTAVIVLSSHDYGDVPTFEALNPNTHPTRTPTLALQELFTRYLPYFISTFFPAPAAEYQQDATLPEAGRKGLQRLLDVLANTRLKVCLVQHLTATEMSTSPDRAWRAIGEMFKERGYPVIQLSKWTKADNPSGVSSFRDDIHLSDFGQGMLAEAIRDCDSQAKLGG